MSGEPDRMSVPRSRDPDENRTRVNPYMLYPSADKNGEKTGMMFNPNRIFSGVKTRPIILEISRPKAESSFAIHELKCEAGFGKTSSIVSVSAPGPHLLLLSNVRYPQCGSICTPHYPFHHDTTYKLHQHSNLSPSIHDPC